MTAAAIGALRVVRGDTPSVVDPDSFWHDVVDSLPAHLAVLAADGSIVAVNEPWSRFSWENGGNEISVGTNYLEVCDKSAATGDSTAREAAVLIREVLAGSRQAARYVYPCHAPGHVRWFVMRVAKLPGGASAGVTVQHYEITAEHAAQDELRLQARLLNEVDAAVIAINPSWRVVFWNAAASRLHGWSATEALGRDIRFLTPPETEQEQRDYAEALDRDGFWDGLKLAKRKDGSVVPVQLRSSVIRDTAGETEWMIGVSSDASARVNHEAELRSARDYLRAVTESIPDGLFTLDAHGKVIYMNPEAERLLGWTIDELRGVLMHDVSHHIDATGKTRSFADSPITASRLENRVVDVDDDLFVRRDGTLLPVAFKASPFETESGVQGTVVVFRNITEEKAARERQERELLDYSWAARVRDGLANNAFTLYAQPIVEIATRLTTQHELLLRLNYDGRVVSPGEFLPAAERLGLMGEIDAWVVGEAIRLATAGHHVQVNLSGVSLSNPQLCKEIESRLISSAADPSLIVVEITETSLVKNEAAAAQILQRLADLGCQIALDDFGTGYGGFTYVKRLPVHFLKIDIEFVRDLTSDRSSRAVVEAVINLARGFGQKTIAEGVEDEATLELLAELGVDYAQGYLFGHPEPADHALPRVRSRP